MSCESPDDEGEDLQALTFDDLLSFAFQVAKGMEFLSSKHVRKKKGPFLSIHTYATLTNLALWLWFIFVLW